MVRRLTARQREVLDYIRTAFGGQGTSAIEA